MRGLIFLILLTTIFFYFNAHPSEPRKIGIRVEVEDGELPQCGYCKSIFRPGSVRKDARTIIENLLHTHLQRMGYQVAVCDSDLPCIYILVYRFEDKIGGDYSVEKPSSVGFHMHLLEKGSLLGTYNFEEEQKPLLSNILAIGKFLRRKGKWVDASTLAEEGISEGLRRLIEERRAE